jgi:hypothetical protein
LFNVPSGQVVMTVSRRPTTFSRGMLEMSTALPRGFHQAQNFQMVQVFQLLNGGGVQHDFIVAQA